MTTREGRKQTGLSRKRGQNALIRMFCGHFPNSPPPFVSVIRGSSNEPPLWKRVSFNLSTNRLKWQDTQLEQELPVGGEEVPIPRIAVQQPRREAFPAEALRVMAVPKHWLDVALPPRGKGTLPASNEWNKAGSTRSPPSSPPSTRRLKPPHHFSRQQGQTKQSHFRDK